MRSAAVRIPWQQETARIMHPRPWRLAGLLCPLLLFAACGGPSGQQRAARQLDHRLEARLAPQINAGNATVQPLPDGARVTLLSPGALPAAQLPPGVPTVGGGVDDGRAKVIQGLLDPRLMRIQLADTSALPPYQQAARVAALTQYFVDYRLGSTLQPAAPPQAMPPGPDGAAPAGLTITISVQCPHDHELDSDDIDLAPPADTAVLPPSCH
jgi:hypothetical protein